MNYAKKLLEDELRLLKKVVEGSDWSNYQEALKDRLRKIKDIEQALKTIKNEAVE
jgi:hypothetical protein